MFRVLPPRRCNFEWGAVADLGVGTAVILVDVGGDVLAGVLDGSAFRAPGAALLELPEPGLDERLALGIAAATSASHPSAAAATLSNCAATNSTARRGKSAADGGAHTRTSARSARNRTASPTIGSTSPRDPVVDNNTRMSQLPFPQVLASAGDSAARPGSCRKPPGALYVESGKE